MKIVASDYTPQEVIKILREWTDLTQKDFGKSIQRTERSIRTLENGSRHITVETLFNIAKTHDFEVIIQKKDKPKK